jgi:pSer/pThr/pTyr-binding forkhead associated (FHA) protein
MMLIDEEGACGDSTSRGQRIAGDGVTRSGAGAARPVIRLALVVTDGAPLGARVAIGNAPVVIGRGAGVDLQIVDPTVSRHHCLLWRAGGRCWIRDLGSRNQTRVNGRAEHVVELVEGDVVVIGQTALTGVATRTA